MRACVCLWGMHCLVAEEGGQSMPHLPDEFPSDLLDTKKRWSHFRCGEKVSGCMNTGCLILLIYFYSLFSLPHHGILVK